MSKAGRSKDTVPALLSVRRSGVENTPWLPIGRRSWTDRQRGTEKPKKDTKEEDEVIDHDPPPTSLLRVLVIPPDASSLDTRHSWFQEALMPLSTEIWTEQQV